MASQKPDSDNYHRKLVATVLLVVGIALIAISFVWPGWSRPRGAWTEQQAEQYQAISLKLHGLSHEVAHADGEQATALRKQFESAKADYEAQRANLELAIARPQRWAWTMRIGGALAMVVGGVLLSTLRGTGG